MSSEWFEELDNDLDCGLIIRRFFFSVLVGSLEFSLLFHIIIMKSSN